MKKEEYSLNVFTYGYYNWKHPIHNIATFFHNLRRAWQRATKGYCDWDTWDLDQYYIQLIVDSLADFQKETNSYPSEISPEEWNKVLGEIQEHLKEGRFNSHDNPWADKLPGLDRINDSDAETNDIRAHFIEEENRLRQLEDEHLHAGLTLLTKWWHHLWY